MTISRNPRPVLKRDSKIISRMGGIGQTREGPS
jgi:hypothetical protein